jgi:uncharacterized protein
VTRRQTAAVPVIGLLGGFASGFMGIGGGLVIVPALVIVCAWPIKRAVGVSLAVVVLISLIGLSTELIVARGNLFWAMGVVLTAGSLLGSWTGGRVLRYLPDAPLRYAFTAVLVVAASHAASPSSSISEFISPIIDENSFTAIAAAVSIGGLAGLTSVLFGVGGGIVTVPMLPLVFGDLTFHAARGTSLLTIVPTAAFSAWQHHRMEALDVAMAKRLLPTGLVGAALGVVSVNLLPARPCRIVLAAFLVLAAVRLLTIRAGGPSIVPPSSPAAAARSWRRPWDPRPDRPSPSRRASERGACDPVAPSAAVHHAGWNAPGPLGRPQFLGRDHDPPLSKRLRTALGNSRRARSTIRRMTSQAGIGSACMEGGQQC